MPIPQPFFLDGSSFSDSTAIYQDSQMNIPAADGWYSDGTIIRQQISGVLQPAQMCVSCGTPCGIGSSELVGSEGIFKMNIDTGSTALDVGAIVIRFTPFNVPDGIKAVFNGITYNQVVSQVEGILDGVPSGLPIFLGATSAQATCPSGSFIGGPFTLSEYIFDPVTEVFDPTGMTENVTVISAQDKTTLTAPGVCVMIIPKTSPTPSPLEITLYGICSSTSFNISIECPTLLKKFKASYPVQENPSTLCDAPLNQDYYIVSVNGTYPYIGLYDCIFLDPYGVNKAPNGYYKTNNLASPNDIIEVVNGVVEQITNSCP